MYPPLLLGLPCVGASEGVITGIARRGGRATVACPETFEVVVSPGSSRCYADEGFVLRPNDRGDALGRGVARSEPHGAPPNPREGQKRPIFVGPLSDREPVRQRVDLEPDRLQAFLQFADRVPQIRTGHPLDPVHGRRLHIEKVSQGAFHPPSCLAAPQRRLS